MDFNRIASSLCHRASFGEIFLCRGLASLPPTSSLAPMLRIPWAAMLLPLCALSASQPLSSPSFCHSASVHLFAEDELWKPGLRPRKPKLLQRNCPGRIVVLHQAVSPELCQVQSLPHLCLLLLACLCCLTAVALTESPMTLGPMETF